MFLFTSYILLSIGLYSVFSAIRFYYISIYILRAGAVRCVWYVCTGDHQQLRPSPNVYELAENYNLKYSLFERLVVNELEHETLHRQHRMRPEIANLLRVIYPTLVDDDSVTVMSIHVDYIRPVESWPRGAAWEWAIAPQPLNFRQDWVLEDCPRGQKKLWPWPWPWPWRLGL